MVQLDSFSPVAFVSAILWTLVVQLSVPVDGLKCYSCHLQPGQNHCLDAARLLRSRQAFEEENGSNTTRPDLQAKYADVLADCGSSRDYCVIESIIADGQFKLMYRDCSDGSSFSTDLSKTRLASTPADNITHCAYSPDIGAQVCITLCDSGDYCNGPSAASSKTPLLSLFLPALCYLSAVKVL